MHRFGMPVVGVLLVAVVCGFLPPPAAAKTQRVGDECSYKQNCQAYADGVGPAWANGAITCAIPQSGGPEHCGSSDSKRNDFAGTCKAVGTLEADEYGCPCGVHKANCPGTSPFSRIFWPQDWLQSAWAQIGH